MGKASRRAERSASVHASRAVAAAIEPLARRVLLSASLSSAGILKLIGSDSADAITVGADPVFINVLDATINGQTTYVSLADVVRIDVRAKGGDDVVRIDASLDALSFRALVDAGAGNDRVTTGSGADTVLGGDGDDRLYGNAGNDKLDGGAGRDSLYGGDGNDTLNGGASNDALNGAAGDDRLEGHKGNDRIDGGAGNDVLSDKSGVDTVMAGDGDDTGNFKDAGRIHGGAGNDHITSYGTAIVDGDDGNDTLVGRSVNGGDGNDTITGTSGDDILHGRAGDDAVSGRGGADQVFGDGGNDALYGGAGNDTLHGGMGDDNLYGDDGASTAAVAAATTTSKRRYDPGHDVGLGEFGSDWFEPTHRWARIDGNKSDKEAGKDQNQITVDSSWGDFGSSYYTGAGSMTVNGSSGAMIDFNSGSTSSSGLIKSQITTTLGGIPVDLSAQRLKSLGAAGWLTNGTFDANQLRFSPVALNSDQRRAVQRAVLELPQGWTLNEMTSARDDIVWYRVSTPVAFADPTATVHVPLDAATVVQVTPAGFTNGGITIVNGTITIGSSTSTTVISTTVSQNSVELPINTPGLLDGVQGNQYRFLAVKRGTVLLNDVAGSAGLWDPKSFAWQSGPVALPSDGAVRLAGSADVFHLGRTFTRAPSDGPVGARGILLNEGAIWLPMDGGAASFISN